MSISLKSNIASLQAQRRLGESGRDLASVFERLSSGQRINKAADDAAGLAISETLRSNSRVFGQAVRNLNDGISLLNIADSTVENLISIVTRLEELTEQAANGSYGASQRKSLDLEAQSLRKEFLRISQASTFNKRQLLTGSLGQINLQAGIGSDAIIGSGIGGRIGTGELGSQIVLNSQGISYDIATGDLNGDGNLDVVTGDKTDNSVSILLGNGSGSFTYAGSQIMGSNVFAVSLADFNGDGVLDLATADLNSTTVSVALGNGNGTFQTRRSYSLSSGPQDLKSADMNGDGIMDLVAAGSDGKAYVLLGAGNGTFGSPISTSSNFGAGSYDMTTGDFNQDGVTDVILAQQSGTRISVMLGTGSGSFSTPVSFVAATSVDSVEAGDFNNDGILDLLVSSTNVGGEVDYLKGNGDGTFATRVNITTNVYAPGAIALADFNGDGNLDAYLRTNPGVSGSGYESIILGNGNGTFTLGTTLFNNGDAGRSAIAGDFNNDGVPDVLSSDANMTQVHLRLSTAVDGVAPILPIKLTTAADARQALPILRRKREQLATQRGQIGAFQSRIGVAGEVLGVSRDAFLAADSRIRNADVADETAQLTRLNIIQNVASAVLAQANQQPALAIQLLAKN